MAHKPILNAEGGVANGVQYFVSYVAMIVEPDKSVKQFFGNVWLNVPTLLDTPEKCAKLEAHIAQSVKAESAHVISFQEIKKG